MEQSDTDKIVVSKLKKIALISLVFMAIQIIGGALANSIAIMADAFHLLSDVIAYAISLYAVLLSKRIAPKNLAFGYEKAQPLGALINVAIIWFVTLYLFIEATHRIVQRQIVKQPLYMLLTSIFGLGCNLYIMKILHSEQGGCHHGHSHGHGHQHKENEHKHSHKQHDHPHSSCSEHHDHHGHIHQQKNSKQNKQCIEAVCSCQSPDQIERATMGSDNDSKKSSGKGQLQLSTNLQSDLVPKHKGYCAVHCNQKNSFSIGCEHQHDHHSHLKHDNTFDNINIRAAYIHIISDIILSIGVIISASIIYLSSGEVSQVSQWTAWQLADPFCTYLFSIVALYSTISIVKDSMLLLMDGCENPQTLSQLSYFVNSIKQNHPTAEVQDFKLWSNSRSKYYCIIKIILRNHLIGEQASQQRTLLKQYDQMQIISQKVLSKCKQLKVTAYIDIKKA